MSSGIQEAFSKSSSLNFLAGPEGSEPGAADLLGMVGMVEPGDFAWPCGTTGERFGLALGGTGGREDNDLTSFHSQ